MEIMSLPMFMAKFFGVVALAFSPLAVFVVWLVWVSKREYKQSQELLAKIDKNPKDLVEVHLFNADPVNVCISLDGKSFVTITHVFGVQAVRLFDELKAKAPGARFRVITYGSDLNRHDDGDKHLAFFKP